MDIYELKLSAPKRLRKKYVTVSLIAIVYWFIDIFRYGTESRQCDIFFLKFGAFISDFTQVIGYAADPDTYNCTRLTGLDYKNYPPLDYVLLKLFEPFVDIDACFTHNYLQNSCSPLLIFMYFAIIAILIFWSFSMISAASDGTVIEKRLTASVLLLSVPVFWTVERGNIIILSAVLTMFFVFNYKNENKIIKELALIALGFAFGLKLSPAIFGFLLLYNKQYKEAVRASVYGLLFLFVPFLFMNGGFDNIPLMIRNLQLTSGVHQKNPDTSQCTLWACFRYFGLDIFTGISKYIVCVYLLICSFFIKKKWEKVLSLTLILLFAVDPSGSYCLLYLIPAAVFFLNEKEHKMLDWVTAAGFLEIFILLKNPFTQSGLLKDVFEKALDQRLGELMLLFVILVRGTRDTVISLIELSAKKKPALLEGKVYLFLTGKIKFKLRKKPVNKKAAKKRLIVLLSILAVVTIATVVVVLNPDIPKEFARQRAIGLYEKGDYEGALPTFERLYYFKDCQEYLDKCKTALNEAQR